MNIKEKLEEIKKMVLNLSNEEASAEPNEVEVQAEETVQASEVEETVEVQEEVPAIEYATKDELADVLEQVKSLFSKQMEKFNAEKKDLEDKNLELSKQLDEKPDAPKIVTAPVEKVELTATTRKGRFYQFLNNNLYKWQQV